MLSKWSTKGPTLPAPAEVLDSCVRAVWVGLLLLGFLLYQEVLGHSHMELWLSEDFSCPELKVGALRPFLCACWLRDTDADDGWFLCVVYRLGEPLDRNGRAVRFRERGGADSREHGAVGQTGQDTAHLAHAHLISLLMASNCS